LKKAHHTKKKPKKNERRTYHGPEWSRYDHLSGAAQGDQGSIADVRALEMLRADKKTRVVVTPPGGAARDARAVTFQRDKTGIHVNATVSVLAPGEYRYVVSYDDQTQEGAALVYGTRGELDEVRCLIRDVRFERTQTLGDLEILKTDDPRTRTVLFRYKLLQAHAGRALTPAEMRHTDVRKRVGAELDKATLTLRGLPTSETFPSMTTTQKLTDALTWERLNSADLDEKRECTTPVAVWTRLASDAERDAEPSRVVAEVEVVYLDRTPTPTPGAYTVSYRPSGAVELSGGAIRVEATTEPMKQKASKRGALVLTCIDLRKKQRAGLEKLMVDLGYEYEHEYESETKDANGAPIITKTTITNYDTFSLAGASLGVVGSDNPKMVSGKTGDTHSALFHDIDSKWDQTFFDQVTVSANLHAIDRIVVVDHVGCSCYNEYYSDYGSKYHGDEGAESVEHHFANMLLFCELIYLVYGDGCTVSGYLLDSEGARVRMPGTDQLDVRYRKPVRNARFVLTAEEANRLRLLATHIQDAKKYLASGMTQAQKDAQKDDAIEIVKLIKHAHDANTKSGKVYMIEYYYRAAEKLKSGNFGTDAIAELVAAKVLARMAEDGALLLIQSVVYDDRGQANYGGPLLKTEADKKIAGVNVKYFYSPEGRTAKRESYWTTLLACAKIYSAIHIAAPTPYYAQKHADYERMSSPMQIYESVFKSV
jgi:hypothetical protein